MIRKTPTLFAACAALLAVAAHAADSFTGAVVAHDRAAGRLVLADKTVVSYDAKKVAVPEDLKAGDRVVVEFTGGEGEIATVLRIRRAG